MLVTGAIVAMIGFQVFVNIGMTVGIMPITGIPLPLMSYGGSHTLTTLVAIGLLYNLGIWIDKFMFWYAPSTGQPVIGPLHASIIYDIPVFLAYLAIIPGMAGFLVRIETDFVEYYDAFYNAVRGGSSLEHIEDMRNTMVQTIRLGLYEIVPGFILGWLATVVVSRLGPAPSATMSTAHVAVQREFERIGAH